MINVARLYCYRQGVTWIEDVPVKEARDARRRLAQQGVIITHTEVV